MLTTEWFNDVLVPQVGKWAKDKGWDDKPRSDAEWRCNLHGEISEAFEEYRSGNMFTYFVHQGILKYEVPESAIRDCYADPKGRIDGLGVDNQTIIRNYKPCGYWSELADVVIRIAHECAVKKIRCEWPDPSAEGLGVLRFLDWCHGITTNEDCESLVLDIGQHAEESDIDIVAEIVLKMTYNETRAYRHGGKLA